MVRFVSLWGGPTIYDNVYNKGTDKQCGYPVEYSNTWSSISLYGLDSDGRPWTLCQWSLDTGRTKWIPVDDLVSGRAARRDQAENA